MKQNKKQKRRVRIGRIYDLLLIPAFIVIAVFFIIAIKGYTSKYLLVAMIALLLILAISLLTFLYNRKAIEIMRRIILTTLCGILFFATSKVGSLDAFFHELAPTEEEIVTTQLNVYSLQSNQYFTAVVNSYEDLDNKTIGIQTSNDKEESAYVYQEIEKKFEGTKQKEYKDYHSMITDLTNGYIDVAVVNTASEESIQEQFGSLSGFTTLIKSFAHEKKMIVDTNEKDIINEPFTVLISGQDEDGIPTDESLSDMNMLIFINPQTYQITTASIPRDSYIPNPMYDYQNDKLTHTSWGGINNTVKAVENIFQIDIDFYIKVSFTSIIKIVDAIGGVEVDVPIRIEEQDENRSFDPNDMVYLDPGVQTLNGKEALAFARHRHGYSNQDVGRNAAQTQVIKGIIKSLMSPTGMTTRLDKVLKIIPTYTLTNFSQSQMKSFVKYQIDEMPSWSISSLTLANGFAPGPEGYIPTATDPATNQSIYYLAEKDVKSVNAIYHSLSEDHTFEEFAFELDNLYQKNTQYQEDENTKLY